MSSSKTIHGHLQPFCSHFHHILDGFWICLGPNHSNVNTRSKNTLKNGRLLNAHWIYSMYLIMIKHLPNIGSGWPSGLRRQSKAQKSFWGAWFESRRASNEIYKIFFLNWRQKLPKSRWRWRRREKFKLVKEKCKLVKEKWKSVNLVCPRRLAKVENRTKKRLKM